MTLHEETAVVVVRGGLAVLEVVASVVVGGAVGVEEATVVGTGSGVVLVEGSSTVDVVESGASAGAATFSAVSGLSLTRSSAALTICHVRVVVSTRTTSHAPNRLKRLTSRLSQTRSGWLVNGSSRFHQAGLSTSVPR